MVLLRYFLVALLLSSAPMQTKMPRMEDECIVLSACDREMMTRHEGAEFVRIPERVRALLYAMRDDVRAMDSDNFLQSLSPDMQIAPADTMRSIVMAVLKACDEGYTVQCCTESTDAVKQVLQEYLETLESGLASVACNQEMTRSCKTKNYPRLTTNSLRVNGSGCFTRNVCIGGQLGVVGDTTLRGNLIVDGTILGDLTVDGNLTVDGTSTLEGLVTANVGIFLPNQSTAVTGFVGPNGPLFQHARFWANNNAGQIGDDANAGLNNPDPTNSPGITISGGDTITFATAGLYLIEYGANGEVNGAALTNEANFFVSLRRNLAEVAGTMFFGTGLVSGAGGVGSTLKIVAASSAIVSFAAGQTLQLHVFSGATPASEIIWPTDGGVQAYVNIYQIA